MRWRFRDLPQLLELGRADRRREKEKAETACDLRSTERRMEMGKRYLRALFVHFALGTLDGYLLPPYQNSTWISFAALAYTLTSNFYLSFSWGLSSSLHMIERFLPPQFVPVETVHVEVIVVVVVVVVVSRLLTKLKNSRPLGPYSGALSDGTTTGLVTDVLKCSNW